MMLHWSGLVLFIYSPELFYWRSWEYFDDFPFKGARLPPYWHGVEYGDLSRKNLFFYQEAKLTLVTTGADGFRRVPVEASRYPVVVGGDSMVWGSGLSDAETLPYRLAERLGVPVFNAGRTSLENALRKPGLRHPGMVVIECQAQWVVNGPRFPEMDLSPGKPYLPLIVRGSDNDLLNMVGAYLSVSSARYSFLLRGYQTFKRLWNDARLALGRKGPEEYLYFDPGAMVPEHLETAVIALKKRHDQLREMGIRYIVVVVPDKQTIIPTPKVTADAFTASFHERLNARLHEVGVERVDLRPSFLAAREQGIYQRYDVHWNERGVDLAAQEIARYLSAASPS
ncbi:MAG: hypothetical protein HQL59_02755 [Magnetococcales bacterium]|nr:hypothetical protein [Magnetococcales bacterium]